MGFTVEKLGVGVEDFAPVGERRSVDQGIDTVVPLVGAAATKAATVLDGR